MSRINSHLTLFGPGAMPGYFAVLPGAADQNSISALLSSIAPASAQLVPALSRTPQPVIARSAATIRERGAPFNGPILALAAWALMNGCSGGDLFADMSIGLIGFCLGGCDERPLLKRYLIRGNEVKPAVEPYGAWINVMRGINGEEVSFKGELSKNIDNMRQLAAKEGRKARLLAIGAGAGMLIYDLKTNYPDVELVFVNKENIQVDKDPKNRANVFAQYVSRVKTDHYWNDVISVEDAEKFLEYFTRNVIIHDASEGLPFEGIDADFDMVLVAHSTIEYVKNKLELLCEVKRVLRKNGIGFINTLEKFSVGYSLADTLQFFNGLKEREYDYACEVRGSDEYAWLKITNKCPENNLLSHLRLSRCLPAKGSDGLTRYANVYEVI